MTMIMRANYAVISVREKNRKRTMIFRGAFIDRAEAFAEARRISDAEGVEVLIDRGDGGAPLRFFPIPRARRGSRARG